MRNDSRHHLGLTLPEVLLGLFVISVLSFILLIIWLPGLGKNTLVRDPMLATLSNMKQLYLATQQMALDGEFSTNSALGWPGDTGGTFSNWTTRLVHGGYLSTNDLAKLLSAPGVKVPTNTIPLTNHTALIVYAVKATSPGDALFLSTANFTYTATGGVYDPTAEPYRNKGFITFRKAGDGAILAIRQANMTNYIGSYVPLCP